MTRCVRLPLAILLVTANWGRTASVENCSYTTLCAEVDNVNIPIYATNATQYRIVAANPRYYPTSIEIWQPDFENCTFATRDIWWIGTNDGSCSEFKSSGLTNGDEYFALDDPAAGIDEAWDEFPREINNDWLYTQYIRFTADENSDFNHELVIGARLEMKLATISGVLEIDVQTWNGTGWVSHGSAVFDSANLWAYWNIPDHTWLPGTDTNVIKLRVVRAGESSHTLTNSWAYYDYLHLRKRDELGDNSSNPTVLFSNADIRVETVWIDFWWRDPRAMTVSVVGGGTDTNVQYLRIKQRMPQTTAWNEIFVLYEDGNARIIPFPPEDLGAVPYGASVILGPTTNSPRPACGINQVTVDPEDLSLDIQYQEGGSAHVELRCDRTAHVVDVSEISYATSNRAVARIRSMWVFDGKADLDRLNGEEGFYPVLTGWTNLQGTWWEFYKEVPSYHNTYCPEFRFELLSPDVGFLSREAESADSTNGCWVVDSRTNAYGGQALHFSTNGGSAVYQFSLASDQPDTWIILRYSDADGGNAIDNLGNAVTVVADGMVTASTYTVDTGGWDDYEFLPSLYLGTMSSGEHQIDILVGGGTEAAELDCFTLVSRPSRTRIARSIITRQAESCDSQTNATFCFRTGAVGGETMHLEHTGGTASVGFDLSFADSWSNVYIRVRYSDDVGPNRIRVVLDDEVRAQFPSETTGGWTNFSDSPVIYLGDVTAGSHTLQLISDTNTWGVDIDEFELYALYDNRAPRIVIPSDLYVLPVGASTSFTVAVIDDDGDPAVVSNTVAPEGAVFSGGVFSWTAMADDENTTNPVLFVADDLRGLSNSVVSNATQIVVPLDSDGDDMPDGWEWTRFGTLTNSAEGDNDQDGAVNYHEYVAGTDPTDSASAFTATLENASGSQHRITIPTVPGRHYTIYFRDGWEAAAWSGFANTNIGVGTWLETNSSPSTFTFVDDEGSETTGQAPPAGRRFYRVKVRRQP